ncbi:MAG: LamG-like jellyroll fold domain-containing protein [Verrucomicrobiota bacterium]
MNKRFPTNLLAGILMFAAVVLAPVAAAAEPVKIIFDTDYSTDCDDPGALAVLHALADLGEVEILATGASTSMPKAPGAIDVVNTYYGRPEIPVAATKVGPSYFSSYVNHLYDNFPHDTPLTDGVPDAVAVYREILAAQPDDSVVLVTVGYLTNVAELLKSGPDEHSPLSGYDLVVQKVREWACMGGNFFTVSSNNVNFTRDQPSTYYAIQNFPKKLTFLPREVASEPSPLRAGQELMGTPTDNPVRIAYQKYFGGGTSIDRHVADPATVLYAARGAADYWDVESTGSMDINTNGTFTWNPAGTQDHHYLVMKGGHGVYSNADYVEGVLRLLMAKPPGGPLGEPPPEPEPVDGLIAWYRFDEAADATIINRGETGAVLDLAQTGGVNGRDGTGAGGHGATGGHGFDPAFDVLASGDGQYHSASTGSSTGGGLTTTAPVPQSALQGANGAFTYEAMVRLSGIAAEQTILSHDGSSARGFLFRVVGGQLSFYHGSGSITATIPTDGAHAFAAGGWYHAAVTYDGAAGVAGNIRFYWTALDAAPAQANEIGAGTLASDLAGSVGNLLGVGTTTRSPYRFELAGLVDEVRLSGHARAAGDFILSAPLVDTSGDGIPDTWALAHGLDPAADNRHGDEDGDGMPNLLEFALGLDPAASSADGLPSTNVEQDHLTLTLARNPAATGLLFSVEVTGNLMDWLAGEEHVTLLADTPELLKARDNTPLSSVGRRFMRVSVAPLSD